jgi:hypothetical protein
MKDIFTLRRQCFSALWHFVGIVQLQLATELTLTCPFLASHKLTLGFRVRSAFARHGRGSSITSIGLNFRVRRLTGAACAADARFRLACRLRRNHAPMRISEKTVDGPMPVARGLPTY